MAHTPLRHYYFNFMYLYFQLAEDDDETENYTPSTSQQVKRPRKKNPESKSDQILDIVSKKLDESVPKDMSSMDHFGGYVTRRLLAMDQRTAIITRKLINDVLFEAEMGNLNSSSRVFFTHQETVPLPIPSTVYSHSSNSSSPTNDSEMSHYYTNIQG